MSTPLKWPSLTTVHPAPGEGDRRAGEHIEGRPTWPAALEHPTTAGAGAGYPQPNLYLQLSQILEWEIWSHGHTYNELWTLQNERMELQAHLTRLTHDLTQWQAACQAAYDALDAHRAEHASLQKNMDVVTAELYRRQQYSPIPDDLPTSSPWQASALAESSNRRISEVQTLPKLEEEDATWRLGFIRDIEEHIRTAD